MSLLALETDEDGLSDRAEDECRIAAVAEPENDVYVNEVAVDLLRADRPLSTLKYLGEQDLSVVRESFLLSHSRGETWSKLELWDRSNCNLERALELIPQSTDTLDELRHCLLMRGNRGDRRRGVKLAKQAARLGAGQTWAAYQAGRYG